jgi:hypothetical protein
VTAERGPDRGRSASRDRSSSDPCRRPRNRRQWLTLADSQTTPSQRARSLSADRWRDRRPPGSQTHLRLLERVEGTASTRAARRGVRARRWRRPPGRRDPAPGSLDLSSFIDPAIVQLEELRARPP